MDPLLMMNTTFTKTVVDDTVDSYTGDYISFQAHLEAVPYPHPGPHFIMGGDMFGTCPFGTVPPACVSGPKWAPNGKGDLGVSCIRVLNETFSPCYIDPMFFLHHAVCLDRQFD